MVNRREHTPAQLCSCAVVKWYPVNDSPVFWGHFFLGLNTFYFPTTQRGTTNTRSDKTYVTRRKWNAGIIELRIKTRQHKNVFENSTHKKKAWRNKDPCFYFVKAVFFPSLAVCVECVSTWQKFSLEKMNISFGSIMIALT